MIRETTAFLSLFAIYLVGAHLRLSITSGGQTVVPMYLSLLPALVFTVLYRRIWLYRLAAPALFLLAFLVAQPLLAAAPGAGGFGTFLSGMSFLVSIVSAVSTHFLLLDLPRDRLRRLVLAVWAGLILLALLELAGLRPLFEALRGLLYAGSGRGVYDALGRDVEIYGHVRPTALASEPSFLAHTLAILATLYLALQPRPGSVVALARFAGMFALSFLIVPSFYGIFYLLALAVWIAWPRRPRQLLGAVAGLVGVVLAARLALTGQALAPLFSEHMASGSFFGRIVVGPRAAALTLAHHPVFGLGVGNTDAAWSYVSEIWSRAGAWSRFYWYRALGADDLLSSGFWWQWMFFGVAGEAVLLGLLAWLLRRAGVARPARSIVCTWIVWYGGGTGVDAVSWFLLAIFSLPCVPADRLLPWRSRWTEEGPGGPPMAPLPPPCFAEPALSPRALNGGIRRTVLAGPVPDLILQRSVLRQLHGGHSRSRLVGSGGFPYFHTRRQADPMPWSTDRIGWGRRRTGWQAPPASTEAKP